MHLSPIRVSPRGARATLTAAPTTTVAPRALAPLLLPLLRPAPPLTPSLLARLPALPLAPLPLPAPLPPLTLSPRPRLVPLPLLLLALHLALVFFFFMLLLILFLFLAALLQHAQGRQDP